MGLSKMEAYNPLFSPQNPQVVIAAKMQVYNGEPNPYYTYISPESYLALKEYMDFRASYGEEITGESWLIRDKFPTATDKHAARKSMATNPQKLSLQGIKKAINRALWAQGLRDLLPKDEHRHEFKLSHGFRKYYKTNTERAGMLSANIAILMDHSEGVPTDNYYRPLEETLLNDYVKSVDFLTINKDQKIASQLQKQVAEMTEKNEQENYVILGKIAEKEKEAETMKKELEKIKAQIPAINRNFATLLMGVMEKLDEGEEFEFEQPDGSGEKVILCKSYPAHNFGLLNGDSIEGNEELAKQHEELRKEILETENV